MLVMHLSIAKYSDSVKQMQEGGTPNETKYWTTAAYGLVMGPNRK